MKRMLAVTLAIAIVVPAAAPALAQQHRDTNQHASSAKSAPARPAQTRPAPQARPAQPARQAPSRPAAPARPATPTRGFDFSNDINAHPAAPQQRPAAPQQRPAAPQQRPAAPQQRPAAPQQRPAQSRPQTVKTVVRNPSRGGSFNGRKISNPQYSGRPSWNWNRGVAWSPAPAYWGGGFWGPFSFGLAIAAAFGAFDYDNQTYWSYQTLPNSPGAELLANYQLTQTPCGPPDLVVIWGPDNSVICAYPNDLVGPGQYDVDTSTLSLVSATQ